MKTVNNKKCYEVVCLSVLLIFLGAVLFTRVYKNSEEISNRINKEEESSKLRQRIENLRKRAPEIINIARESKIAEKPAILNRIELESNFREEGEVLVKSSLLYDEGSKYPYVLSKQRYIKNEKGQYSDLGSTTMVADHVIVIISPQNEQKLKNFIKQHEALKIRKSMSSDGHYLVSSSKKVALDTVETLMQQMKLFKISKQQPDYINYMSKIPNDKRYNEMWGLHNTGQTGGLNDADIDAPEAWDIETGKKDIVVAVIDTGVDYDHIDLKSNMWTSPEGFHGKDFVDDDNDPDDVLGSKNRGHGTHVAGVIAAEANNNEGVVGVCWNAEIMAVRVLGGDGRGSSSDIIDGIDFAVKNGAQVINMSLGSTGGFQGDAYFEKIKEAQKAGVLVIAAAGNGGGDQIADDNDATPVYPASYNLDNIISVYAVDHKDQVTSFSNYGKLSVDVAAPGVRVLSTIPGDKYEFFTGTSMAAPHVSGIAALLFSADNSLNYLDVRTFLLENGDSLSGLSSKTSTGKRVNANAALENYSGLLVEAIEIKPVTGNGDDYINPQEEVDVGFILKNASARDSKNISIELAVMDSNEYIDLLKAKVEIATLNSKNELKLSGAFRFKTKEGSVFPQKTKLTLTVNDLSKRKKEFLVDFTIYRAAHISGQVVRNASSEPLAGAEIHYKGVIAGSALSGSDGRFRIEGVAGEYQIYAASDGLIHSKEVNLKAPVSDDLLLRLGDGKLKLNSSLLEYEIAKGQKESREIILELEGDTPREIDYEMEVIGVNSKLYALKKNASDYKLLEIDLDSGETLDSKKLPALEINDATSMTILSNNLWVTGLNSSNENVVILIDLETYRVKNTIKVANGTGNLVGIGGYKKEMYLIWDNFRESELLKYDKTTEKFIKTGKVIRTEVLSFAFSEERESLYIGGVGYIEEWDLEKLEKENTINVAGLIFNRSLFYDGDNKCIITLQTDLSSGSERLVSLNPNDGVEKKHYEKLSEIQFIGGGADTGVSWIEFKKIKGTTKVGEMARQSLKLNSENLSDGEYETKLKVSSDLLAYKKEFPVKLSVGKISSEKLVAWYQNHGIERGNVEQDTDLDGYEDVLEYIFGGDPLKNSLLNNIEYGNEANKSEYEIEIHVRKFTPEWMLNFEQSRDLKNWRHSIKGLDYHVRKIDSVDATYEKRTLSWPRGEGESDFIRVRANLFK